MTFCSRDPILFFSRALAHVEPFHQFSRFTDCTAADEAAGLPVLAGIPDPTRPVPAGMGRVRVDVLRVGSGTGTKSTDTGTTGIPGFTREEHFHDVGAISNVFLFLPFKNITYDKS